MRQSIFTFFLMSFVVIFSLSPAQAVQVVADSVSENFVPPLHNGACIANVAVTSDGSIGARDGYCPTPATPSNYEISFNFSLGINEQMSSIIIWANSGGIYSDGELRSFDLEVDYIDNTGLPATLVMNGVNIGDTLNANDPKTVLFTQAGTPVELSGVSQIRMSNLGGFGPIEMTFRELVGDVNPVIPANPELSVTKTADNLFNVAAGTLITYTYVVQNTGNQTLSNIQLNDVHNGFGPTPVPSNETLSNDNAISGDSSDGSVNDGVWDILAPFDEVTFTAVYTVTQQDVDQLQ